MFFFFFSLSLSFSSPSSSSILQRRSNFHANCTAYSLSCFDFTFLRCYDVGKVHWIQIRDLPCHIERGLAESFLFFLFNLILFFFFSTFKKIAWNLNREWRLENIIETLGEAEMDFLFLMHHISSMSRIRRRGRRGKLFLLDYFL